MDGWMKRVNEVSMLIEGVPAGLSRSLAAAAGRIAGVSVCEHRTRLPVSRTRRVCSGRFFSPLSTYTGWYIYIHQPHACPEHKLRYGAGALQSQRHLRAAPEQSGVGDEQRHLDHDAEPDPRLDRVGEEDLVGGWILGRYVDDGTDECQARLL